MSASISTRELWELHSSGQKCEIVPAVANAPPSGVSPGAWNNAGLGEAMDFEALANKHKDAVYRQMLRACGNHEDAEDVLVEALFRAYRYLDRLEDSEAFRAWLAAIGRRVCWRPETARSGVAIDPALTAGT